MPVECGQLVGQPDFDHVLTQPILWRIDHKPDSVEIFSTAKHLQNRILPSILLNLYWLVHDQPRTGTHTRAKYDIPYYCWAWFSTSGGTDKRASPLAESIFRDKTYKTHGMFSVLILVSHLISYSILVHHTTPHDTPTHAPSLSKVWARVTVEDVQNTARIYHDIPPMTRKSQ